MLWLAIGTGAVLAWLGTWLGTGQVLEFLRRRAILDHPNERSSHARPTPRGGGLAVVASVIVVWSAGADARGRLDGRQVACCWATTLKFS